ncbi:Protein of unknown function [Roseovarius pacificus]|uniref:Acyclic terpene utilisation N-terminal domain-containing protein n=1 Tax=Roseovarius pacificus TaxID=337701 RepID=A0A1M7GSS4_9RHOB|nr:acyclic terpene utilization AtuA family protein [Roseovarius pacificus]GGO60261.1 ABC transporter substrate-binding protein [Roseovarius pacificus]SHM19392.1 Protein of unknown function [Roseovarius pacificus]
MTAIRIGAGAGFSGDRIGPAVDLARRGELDFLIFECLAERTIAQAQLNRLSDSEGGFDPHLEARMRAVLPICQANGTRIISNMGAANPLAAARHVARLATELGVGGLCVAAVTGDDVLAYCRSALPDLDNGLNFADIAPRVISANAYIGAGPVVRALENGADVVLTGRVADPALFLAPLIHRFGWRMDDWDRLGKGTLAGHLLECAGQICGGYFADPGFNDVPDLANLGFPIGLIDAEGGVEITKLPGTGGAIRPATVKEQILYEILDPARYLQPDVIADFSNVAVEQIGPDHVRVTGATGHPRTGKVKATISYHDGYIGEGQISYAGPGAVARAELARSVIRQRLEPLGLREGRVDLIGVDALHGPLPGAAAAPNEVRLRAIGRSDDKDAASMIGQEVEALYTNGPAGGGGAWKSVRAAVSLCSALLDERVVDPDVTFYEAQPT